MNAQFLLAGFLMTALAGLCVSGAASVEDGSVVLVRDGKPAAYLVMGSSPDALERSAARDFVAIVERMTGARLPEEPQEGLIPIYIGDPAEFPHLPFAVSPLAREEFELRITPEGVFILGGSSLGAGHGVYTLLRDLGCRWVMPGDIGECLPQTGDIRVRPGKRREGPAFSYREIWYAYGSSPEAAARRSEWMRRNRMYRPPVMHGHNLTSTLERVAPFEKRPELYALIHGERKKTQICTSNPETVGLVVQSIKEYMAGNPQIEAYSLCPDDNHDFCECADCRVLDSGEIDAGGIPSVSDRYQVFLNQVLDGLEDDYPDLLVSTYSYNVNHTYPPVRTPVHPRTCIFTTTSMYCSAHGIGDEFCPSRQEFRALLGKWTALTPHVYVYEYDPVPYSGGLPWPMWHAHDREMKIYRDIGVQGFSFEGQNSWAAYFPNYYMAAQFMWDPSQDGEAVFRDMLESFFQEAAPEMLEYHASLASAFDGLEKKVEWGLADYPKYFTTAIVDRCRAALEAAEQKPVSSLVRRRLEMVRLSFDEMDAYLKLRRPGASTTFEEYKAEIDRLNGTIERMASLNEDFLLADIALQKTNAGIADRFAREQGFINEWLLCGPFDNLGMDGHDRAYPPEVEIDLAATYSGKNDAVVSWKPNRTPKWSGYVDFLNEFTDTDWTCAYAVCWVAVEDGPKEVKFRVGSNDSIKVFLNGVELWNNKVHRTASVDQDVIPVTLPQGISTVLLKIGQTGAGWGFYFRITEPDSLVVPSGVKISATPPH